MTYNPFFDYQKERNAIKSGARHRKCGSKTKYVSLPSDHMTAAEWKRRNGTVATYNITEPMKWAEYKKMPDDLKGEYMLMLLDNFKASSKDIAEMFGVSIMTVTGEVKRLNLAWKRPQGKKLYRTASEIAKWEAWNRGEVKTVFASAPLPVEQPAETTPEPEPAELPPMAVHSWETSLHGAFNPKTVLEVLAALVQPGELVSLKISVVK